MLTAGRQKVAGRIHQTLESTATTFPERIPMNKSRIRPHRLTLDYVLWYLKHGWYVLPLCWIEHGFCSCGKEVCPSAGKHPYGLLVPNGLKQATSDPNVVRRWWTLNPRANVGIATGQISGIAVMDIDPRNGGTASLEALIARIGPVPTTATVRTGGGGFHYYFQHLGDPFKGGSNVLGRGIDIKADGGYVVAPPSIHLKGINYAWQH
jgi:putative DNA primase/helicase